LCILVCHLPVSCISKVVVSLGCVFLFHIFLFLVFPM
jgi:hypothetical protein